MTCLEDAVGLLGERHKEIKFLVARPVAEVMRHLFLLGSSIISKILLSYFSSVTTGGNPM